MATKWYNSDRPADTPIRSHTPQQTHSKRQPFWMNPEVYFPPDERKTGELTSDSIHINDDQPLQVLFAGHVGAKGFADPRAIKPKDLHDPVLHPRDIRSPTKEDIKNDLRRLDHIYRESVDDVIAHYLDGSTPATSTTQSPGARFKDPPSLPRPHWDANQPPRHTRARVERSPPPKAAASPQVAKVITVRPRPHHDPAANCSCCADVNAENARRRGDVSYLYSPGSIRIDYPESLPSSLSSIRLTPEEEQPPAPSRVSDIGKALSHQPLSTLIREQPAPRAASRLPSDDLYLIYDDNNMHAGWVPFDDLKRFDARRGGRVMYGETGLAYINYEYPQEQVVVAEDPAIETQRRKLELDVLNSYGKYKNSMNRLGQYIDDLDDGRTVSPQPSPVPFPQPRRDSGAGPIQHRAAQPSDRTVRFSNDSPLQYVYTPPLSTPQYGASR